MSSKGDEMPEVHSANSWETANLGDKSRNEKFLRLMGAAKKEHHGRFIIGDNDPSQNRAKPDEKHIEEDLTDQYDRSMEHRLAGGRKGHVGLGFHEAEEKQEPKQDEDCDDDTVEKEDADKKEETEKVDEKDSSGKKEESEESEEKEKHETKEKEEHERKRESSEPAESEHEDAKKMKFVKSSS